MLHWQASSHDVHPRLCLSNSRDSQDKTPHGHAGPVKGVAVVVLAVLPVAWLVVCLVARDG